MSFVSQPSPRQRAGMLLGFGSKDPGWVDGMPSKAARSGELWLPGKGSLAAFHGVVGFGRAQLGVPGCSKEGTHLGAPL